MSEYERILRGRPERCPVCDEFQLLYGFAGGITDPRDFIPDEEGSSPHQRERWKNDCARVRDGLEPEHLPQGCRGVTYGIGVYYAPCEHQEVAP